MDERGRSVPRYDIYIRNSVVSFAHPFHLSSRISPARTHPSHGRRHSATCVGWIAAHSSISDVRLSPNFLTLSTDTVMVKTRSASADSRRSSKPKTRIATVGKKMRSAKRGVKQALSKRTLLLDLGRELVSAKLVCRPSKRNRSPYVADVTITAENDRTAIAYVISSTQRPHLPR